MQDLAERWRLAGPCRAHLGLALRLLWNTVHTFIGDWHLRLFGARREAPQEPPEIQRLQAIASAGVQPEVANLSAEAVGRAEILAEILVFCSILTIGRCAPASHDFHQGAIRDDLWRKLCSRRWLHKQHSVHMRRWLAASSARYESEDLLTEFASEEQMLQCRDAAQTPWADTPRCCRVASWQDRYVFAERDAKRMTIAREELCRDSPSAGSHLSDASGQDCAAETPPRRWAITLHFAHSFDLEGFFHFDGKFFDTGRFRHSSAPWHFVHGPKGDVMVQISPQAMQFPPMRLSRNEDWGWRLTSTGRLENMVQISSRQLSPHEHNLAARTPTEIVTLIMQRCSDDADSQRGPFGTWRCIRAYQGVMPGPCWVGRPITIEQGSLTISLSNSMQLTCRCDIDEVANTIDVTERSDMDQQHDEGMNVERGVYQLEADGRVLVATRNELRGGPRPAGPPEGLPSIEEILRDEMIDLNAGASSLIHM